MSLFRSRKFWMGIGGVIAVAVSHQFGVSEETVLSIVAIIIAMIFGQSMADFGKERK